jgi:hypothetical protein
VKINFHPFFRGPPKMLEIKPTGRAQLSPSLSPQSSLHGHAAAVTHLPRRRCLARATTTGTRLDARLRPPALLVVIHCHPRKDSVTRSSDRTPPAAAGAWLEHSPEAAAHLRLHTTIIRASSSHVPLSSGPPPVAAILATPLRPLWHPGSRLNRINKILIPPSLLGCA